MGMEPLKKITRMALATLFLTGVLGTVYILNTGWEIRTAYPQEIESTGSGVSVYQIEMPFHSVMLMLLSAAVVVLSGTILSIDSAIRRRRLLILKDTIRQCKEYTASLKKSRIRNNMFFFQFF